MRHFSRDTHCDNRTITRPGMEEKSSIYQPGSLVHVQDAQSAPKPDLGEIETLSAIADR